jgi:hypothetical protein
MAKFKGPGHITEITLPSGVYPVVDGEVVVHLLNVGDVTGLKANGFVLVPEGSYFAVPAPDPEPEPDPAKVSKPGKASPATTE